MNAQTSEQPKRCAVLSMDVEDWYHIDYLDRSRCDTSYSLLDGLDRYLEILSEENVPSSFFVLGELAASVARRLESQADVGVHGWSHRRPLTLTLEDFGADIRRTKLLLEDQIGREVTGHRASCFSIDRNRLDIVQEAGFLYDSSRIEFSRHPLYGTLDLSGYETARPWVYRKDGFFEFEVSTARYLGQTVPISGGGYLRIFPWQLMRFLLLQYFQRESFYVLYIHPFELSSQPDPTLPPTTRWPSRLRFSRGRRTTPSRLRSLIALLRENGFEFSTFRQVREDIISSGLISRGVVTLSQTNVR